MYNRYVYNLCDTVEPYYTELRMRHPHVCLSRAAGRIGRRLVDKDQTMSTLSAHSSYDNLPESSDYEDFGEPSSSSSCCAQFNCGDVCSR